MAAHVLVLDLLLLRICQLVGKLLQLSLAHVKICQKVGKRSVSHDMDVSERLEVLFFSCSRRDRYRIVADCTPKR